MHQCDNAFFLMKVVVKETSWTEGMTTTRRLTEITQGIKTPCLLWSMVYGFGYFGYNSYHKTAQRELMSHTFGQAMILSLWENQQHEWHYIDDNMN